MAVEDVAREHYLAQRALQAGVVAAAVADWQTLDPVNVAGSWSSGVGESLFVRTALAQMLAASLADGYVDGALAEQGVAADAAGPVGARGFAGAASDGRSLETLLFEPVVATRAAFGAGATASEALDRGARSLTTIVQTQVADAGRTAVGAAIAARPAVSGWVRMLSLPSCSRCAVLAGRFYRWNHGFQRHPHCDCRHIPASEDVAGDLTTDARAAIEAGQVTGLSEADRRAIVDDGADVSRVINAHRGMYTADALGSQLKATHAAAGQTVRLRPESIYRLAGGDRGEAIRLLKAHGYIT